MRLIVGYGSDRRLGLLGQLGEQLGGSRDAVADQQDQRTGLESAGGFIAVADRNHRQAVGAQPLERLVQRRWYAFDQHDDRGRTGGRDATRLIFDQSPPGERQQGAKLARIVLLIGSDQRADRHPRSVFPNSFDRLAIRRSLTLSNRFLAETKVVNWLLP